MFEPIGFSLDPIELGKALAEIERFCFPFLDVALEVFYLFTDGFTAGFQLFDRVSAEKRDQLFLFRDLVV